MNNLPFAIDNGQVRFAVTALRNLDYAKLLAEPILTTMNGQTADFKSGGQFPTPILASGGTNSGQNLQGVQFHGDFAETETVVMRARTGTVRTIKTTFRNISTKIAGL